MKPKNVTKLQNFLMFITLLIFFTVLILGGATGVYYYNQNKKIEHSNKIKLLNH